GPDGDRQPTGDANRPHRPAHHAHQPDHPGHGQHRPGGALEPGAVDHGPDPAGHLVRVRQPGPPAGATRRPCRGAVMNRALAVDRAWTGILWATALLVVGILLSIIGYFVIQSLGTLSLGFIFGTPSNSSVGGIFPLIFNSFYILVLTLLIT